MVWEEIVSETSVIGGEYLAHHKLYHIHHLRLEVYRVPSSRLVKDGCTGWPRNKDESRLAQQVGQLEFEEEILLLTLGFQVKVGKGHQVYPVNLLANGVSASTDRCRRGSGHENERYENILSTLHHVRSKASRRPQRITKSQTKDFVGS